MSGRKCGAEFDFTMLGEVSLYRGVWKQGYSYSLDEVVEYDGNLYRSLTDENQTTPAENIAWKNIIDIPTQSPDIDCGEYDIEIMEGV